MGWIEKIVQINFKVSGISAQFLVAGVRLKKSFQICCPEIYSVCGASESR
jgi:hypothetical protein